MFPPPDRPVATLIGDVVGSRRAPDRAALHEALVAATAELNATADPVIPLRITLGDEFQGAFADVPAAVRAQLALRLELADRVDTRYGLGWGTVRLLDPSGQVQDGPGWWTARAAIGDAAELARGPRARIVRARFADAATPGGTPYRDGAGTPLAGLVNATLRALDEHLAGLSDLDVRLIRGRRLGRTQAQLAAAEGLTQSAVSQRLARDGAWAVLDVLGALAPEGTPPGRDRRGRRAGPTRAAEPSGGPSSGGEAS